MSETKKLTSDMISQLMPDTVLRTSLSTSDANTAISTGVYRVMENSQNFPAYTLGGILMVFVWDVNAVHQVFLPYTASTNIYVRKSGGNLWHPWRKISTAEV